MSEPSFCANIFLTSCIFLISAIISIMREEYLVERS